MINNIPADYMPYSELVFCSNTLKDVRIPITVNNFPVFLLGKSLKGHKVMVWLAAPLNKEATQWQYVVEGRKANSPHTNVITKHGTLRVHIGSTLVLEAQEMSTDKAVVRRVDLRPLGLSVFGNEMELHVASQTLANNSFTNVNTMIAID